MVSVTVCGVSASYFLSLLQIASSRIVRVLTRGSGVHLLSIFHCTYRRTSSVTCLVFDRGRVANWLRTRNRMESVRVCVHNLTVPYYAGSAADWLLPNLMRQTSFVKYAVVRCELEIIGYGNAGTNYIRSSRCINLCSPPSDEYCFLCPNIDTTRLIVVGTSGQESRCVCVCVLDVKISLPDRLRQSCDRQFKRPPNLKN